ncbi:hypothetical protein J9236_00165 [Providencia rettgeri]|uniref:hypothetical protein n=1 Tax=Providencia rettgeri TaxID=587 RepID=UPI001B3618F8|nr:hypothetical protein [Providencia rettgeri]MBQ0339654.1 hypothetical protein [Providencia rettgeri]
MEFKHSPAPWKYNSNITGDVDDSTGAMVACVYPIYDKNAEEMKANAYLIAAAPELLEVLIDIVEMQSKNYGNGTTTHIKLKKLAEKANLAITKALGQQ